MRAMSVQERKGDNMTMNITEFVNDYVDRLNNGDTFNARQVARAFRDYYLKAEGKPRLPYSDTIQRVLRERRALKGDVYYFDYGKSIWWKNDHVATKEERCCRNAKYLD